MILEIICGIVGIAFIVLVIFFILTMHKLRKVIKKTDHILTEVHYLLHTLAEPSVALMQNTNKLILDIKRKSEGLDVIFHPLYSLKKDRSEESSGYKKICEISECIIEGVLLFSKIKNGMK